MKITELRRGNLVYIQGEVKTVLGFFNEMARNSDATVDFVQADNLLDYMLYDLQPIPLSEEILLKVGFEKHHPDGNLYSFQWILTSLSDGKKIDKNFSVALFEGFYVACQCQNTHLRYLHELQNLFYFTAQGQELNTSGL